MGYRPLRAGRAEEQELPLILCYVPSPFHSNFMEILRKANWSKKDLFEPFLLIYSFVPLSYLQIPWLTSFHLCFLLLFSFFRSTAHLAITISVNLTWMHMLSTDPQTPLVKIPFYHPGLVFGILRLTIPILAITAYG